MDTRNLIKSKFIKARDIGKETDATIAGVSLADNKHTGDKQVVVKFSDFEPDKPLALNVTNHKAIAKVTGSYETDDWIGVKIQLYTVVEPMADDGRGVRVRDVSVVISGSASATDEEFDDAITF